MNVLSAVPILPVVVMDDAAIAPDLMQALAAGGIRAAEIALRTAASLDALARAVAVSAVAVGAGTVLTRDQVDRVADAGAAFIVSPGFDEEVVERALELGLGVLPGVATPTEIQRALRAGIDVLKFFPADRLGGLATIDALAGPFPDVGFIPSGGVTPANLADYLAHPSVAGVSGSWMATRALLAARAFDEVARLSREAMELVP